MIELFFFASGIFFSKPLKLICYSAKYLIVYQWLGVKFKDRCGVETVSFYVESSATLCLLSITHNYLIFGLFVNNGKFSLFKLRQPFLFVFTSKDLLL